MPATRSKDEIVAALHDTFDALIELAHSLDGDQWLVASECPGWNVRDVYAHMLGTERMLLGQQPPPSDAPVGDHVRNDIGRFNEQWVDAYRNRPPSELVADFEATIAERYAALDAMPEDKWEEVGFTPAGQDTHGRFMQIRVFDCWIHEQDVRGPLGLPGHASGPAVEVALDELTTSMGYVFGKKVGATEGQSLTLRLQGDASRTIHVRVEGRATVVPELHGDPTVTVTIPTLDWFRIAAGRRPGDPDAPGITIEGDVDLGRRLIEHAAYTI